jgi:hypothetical protein
LALTPVVSTSKGTCRRKLRWARSRPKSLPPDRLDPSFLHYTLVVVKDLPDEIRIGSIAKDFQQPGGGIQIHFPGGIRKWIEDG